MSKAEAKRNRKKEGEEYGGDRLAMRIPTRGDSFDERGICRDGVGPK
jgi:hypothetical protein